jgi:hypothetical protein
MSPPGLTATITPAHSKAETNKLIRRAHELLEARGVRWSHTRIIRTVRAWQRAPHRPFEETLLDELAGPVRLGYADPTAIQAIRNVTAGGGLS